MPEDSSLRPNVDRFRAHAERYGALRPRAPAEFPALVARLVGATRLRQVVDLGCGTGLSTRIWASHADAVLGVDPGDEMLAQARACLDPADRITYRCAYAHETGLPDGYADAVTAVQSFHWMEPERTIAEVARLLRPGGVFAALDADFPPLIYGEVDAAFLACIDASERYNAEHGLQQDLRVWDKRQHAERLLASGLFRQVREVALHRVEAGDAERLVGLLLTLGDCAAATRHGATEQELGIDRLRSVARHALGDGEAPWHWCFRARIAVK